ncbi:unnamed protein product [Caenorhabditis auriculariae]|uniref:Homeobox domain-containing protein n=1 Tax=Caenorhabditis auriculariae TaxID=2777116 RepID=A0A8S1GP38_9PELO|nr:unnamed protein product [Caenorhabditis auriculariae]
MVVPNQPVRDSQPASGGLSQIIGKYNEWARLIVQGIKACSAHTRSHSLTHTRIVIQFAVSVCPSGGLFRASRSLRRRHYWTNQKRFRCNVCNQYYGQGQNLDIHLRSVAHQTRMGRIAELAATGDVDVNKPIIEQPGGLPQSLIKDLIRKEDEQSASRQFTVMDVMNMFLPKNYGDASNGDTPSPEGSPTGLDEASTSSNNPRSGANLLSQIQVYGEDKLTTLVPSLAERLPRLPTVDDAVAAALNQFDCEECGETLPGLLAFNLHYEEAHSSNIPTDFLRSFAERIVAATSEEGQTNGEKTSSPRRANGGADDLEPPEKRVKSDVAAADSSKQAELAHMAQMYAFMQNMPFLGNGPLSGYLPPGMAEMFPMMSNPAAMTSSPAKRARTRITDEQLKILRQYFDINNSPTENQIKEMSMKAGLPEKVIKHWFRNTLFKERQRDKDSPYNFNVPPQMSLDLDTYEKTGEAKVVTLSSEVKPEPSSSITSISAAIPEEKPKLMASEVAPPMPQPPLNLQAMLSQMQANAFPFMDAAQFMAAGPMSQMTPQTSSSGRRANRTRFTDYQLRTLQQFFDKQAYPKDDDLEILSKKLQLSPRVIVVWFQNARQKARKIYENQPNHESNDRFVRTPGSNFQCKRCSQVFQRYYELIQHQQKKCYKDDGLALVHDNKSVEESLTEEEKLATHAAIPSVADLKPPTDLLKLLVNSKSNTDVLLKMCETVGTSAPAFHKRCPFCSVAFRCKKTMSEHLQTKHAPQMMLASFDLDMLPNADEVPSFLSAFGDSKDSSALDLSGTSSQDAFRRESLSISPHPGHSDDDVMTEALEDSPFASFPMSALSSGNGARSPANNKRYRTHLTPIQVHVMKNVFADYKTPSMAECEMLGREIGLHKRVVQVWFQNARAKERKTRPANADEDQRPLQANCSICGVEYNGRLSMQDHIFSSEHIGRLKMQLKSEGISDVVTDIEKRNRSSSNTPMSSSGLNLNAFPFNFMNGMLGGGLPFLDVNLFGTPIPMLQIPEIVKLQISSDIASTTATSTTFTQDAETVDSLRDQLPEEEKPFLQSKDKEVGWACPSCTNVFQEVSKLREHQKSLAMCQNCEGTFTLVQTHYECNACPAQFGMAKDYMAHIHSPQHIQQRNRRLKVWNKLKELHQDGFCCMHRISEQNGGGRGRAVETRRKGSRINIRSVQCEVTNPTKRGRRLDNLFISIILQTFPTLNTQKRWGVIRHPFVLNYLNHKLLRCALFYTIHIIAFFSFLLLLSWHVFARTFYKDVLVSAFVLMFFIFMVLKGSIKARITKSVSFWFVVAYIFNMCTYAATLAYVWLPTMFRYDDFHQEMKNIVLWFLPIVAIISAWANFLYILRKSPFGIYIFMMTRILRSFGHIATIWIPTLIAFSFAFHLIMRDSGIKPWDTIDNQTNATMVHKMLIILQAVTKTSTMMIGEVDANDILDTQQWIPSILVLAFEIITVILLMNLMVSLAVGDVSDLRNSAQDKLLKIKVNFVIEALQLNEQFGNNPILDLHTAPTSNILVINEDGTYFTDRDKFPDLDARKIPEEAYNISFASTAMRLRIQSLQGHRKNALLKNCVIQCTEAPESGIPVLPSDQTKSYQDQSGLWDSYAKWIIGLDWAGFLDI